MEWNDYKNEFIKKAKAARKSNDYCDRHLSYAKNLFSHNLPIIYNQEHLCLLLGYKPSFIYAISNDSKYFYRKFDIPKRNGGFRHIAEPLPELKTIQTWILHNILDKCPVSVYAKAYMKGLSVKDNAKFHRKQRKVLSLDVKQFFDSISKWHVYNAYLNMGYNEQVSMMLSELSCLNNALPQGAPTSSALSNLIMVGFDNNVGAFCRDHKIRYTRYADDMTFSGDFDEIDIIRFVSNECKKLSLELNESKTRVRKQGQQQEVTGIVVNNKLQLPKSQRKAIRQSIYYIQKFGLQSHLDYIHETRTHYLNHLLGIISYACFINPKDTEMAEYKSYVLSLLR